MGKFQDITHIKRKTDDIASSIISWWHREDLFSVTQEIVTVQPLSIEQKHRPNGRENTSYLGHRRIELTKCAKMERWDVLLNSPRTWCGHCPCLNRTCCMVNMEGVNVFCVTQSWPFTRSFWKACMDSIDPRGDIKH